MDKYKQKVITPLTFKLITALTFKLGKKHEKKENIVCLRTADDLADKLVKDM